MGLDPGIDQMVAEAVNMPIVQKLVEAARNGHLCIHGEAEGVRLLKGDETWFEESVGQWGNLLYLQRCWVLRLRSRLCRGTVTRALGWSGCFRMR